MEILVLAEILIQLELQDLARGASTRRSRAISAP